MSDINPVKDTGVIKKPVRLAENAVVYDTDKREHKWIPDKAGYFLIRTQPEQNRIQVGVCESYKKEDINLVNRLYNATIDDRIESKILEEGLSERAYKGGPLTRLYSSIVENGDVTSLNHACYLGKEIGRAWVSLRLGFKYEQDGISL